MLLPENGSIVIIDDQPSEALPIMQAFSKNGIAFTFYKGNDPSELPHTPNQLVRIVFLDLQLFDVVTDEHQIKTSLVNVLKRIIAPENGPYLLINWSKNYAKYGKAVEEEIKKPEHKIVPSYIISFNKRDCIVEQTVEPVDSSEFIKEVTDSIKSRFDDDDITAIGNAIEEAIKSRGKPEFLPKGNAIEIIEKHIKEQLEKAGVFHLFIIWENLVKKSSSKIVGEISSLVSNDENWEVNMRDIFRRMGVARVGQNVISDDLLLKESINTFGNSFIDCLEDEVKKEILPQSVVLVGDILFADKIGEDNYMLKKDVAGESCYKDGKFFGKDKNREAILKNIEKNKKNLDVDIINFRNLIKKYNVLPSLINTKLHIELSPSQDLIPGNIYLTEGLNEEKKKKYLKTYFKLTEEDVSKYFLIELEVSPICDYAQNKWKRSRTLPGVIYPSMNAMNLKNAGHFYIVEPEFEIEGELFKMCFDFHLFNALDKIVAVKRFVKYRLKRELLQDIIAQLSSHINRAGITYVS